MGTRDGSIIATIITIHMPRNIAAAPGHDWPGIRIHAIDMVQPPGMGMPPIADIDAHQMTVTAALTASSSAETAMNQLASLIACRIGRGDATRSPARCGPSALGRATDTRPRGHRVRAQT